MERENESRADTSRPNEPRGNGSRPSEPREVLPTIGPLASASARSLDPAPSHALVFVDAGVPSDLVPTIAAGIARVLPGVPVTFERVSGGEAAKSLDGWRTLLDRCRAHPIDRRSVLVAVGGGALGDAVGFTAATWARGLRWIAVPTTLLAMVDAALGGKTALDHGTLKNAVGAFWWPEAILADPRFLESLPERELRSGWAEMIKAAWIGDAPLFEKWEELPPRVEDAVDRDGRPRLRAPTSEEIDRAVAVKCRVVAEDPLEEDRRRVLNLGHTLGHALEISAEEGALSHGEAVATGMAFAAAVSLDRDPAEGAPRRLVRLLDRLGYATRWPVDRGEELLSLVRSDKKVRDGRVVLALPVVPGRVDLVPLATEELRAAIARGGVPDAVDASPSKEDS